jgi:hypothetical protein
LCILPSLSENGTGFSSVFGAVFGAAVASVVASVSMIGNLFEDRFTPLGFVDRHRFGGGESGLRALRFSSQYCLSPNSILLGSRQNQSAQHMSQTQWIWKQHF